jgi:hypothetical protein
MRRVLLRNYSACSVQTQPHDVWIIVTTACRTNKGEGGTGETQIK